MAGSAVVSLAAIEGGEPIAIGVSLDHEPDEPIVVTLTADPVVALDRTTLTFTPADFDRPQPVVITAVEDDDVIDGDGDIVLAASQVDELVLPIAVADDDEVALAGLPAQLIVMEGSTANLRFSLAADPGNLELLAELPIAAALVRRVLELDAAFDAGAADEFFIAYEAGRPGGDLRAARAHYERAVVLSGGRRASVHLALAESVAVQEQDIGAFRRLIAAALAVDPDGAPERKAA